MRAGVRRLAGFASAVVVSSVVMLALAAPAAAHTVTGVAPTNYRSQLLGVTPAVPGLTVRLLDLGRRVQLTNRGPTEVVVMGYQAEPYLRVGPSGVYENRRAPALYQNRTVPRG